MLRLIKPDSDAFARWFEESSQRQAEDRAWAAGGSVEQHRAEVDQMVPMLLPEGLDTPGHTFRIAVDEASDEIAFVWIGTVPGMAPDTRFLFDIVVRPEHRRKGHAREVMKKILDDLSSEAVKNVILQARSDNGPALSLYESLGFARTETSEDGKQVQMALGLRSR